MNMRGTFPSSLADLPLYDIPHPPHNHRNPEPHPHLLLRILHAHRDFSYYQLQPEYSSSNFLPDAPKSDCLLLCGNLKSAPTLHNLPGSISALFLLPPRSHRPQLQPDLRQNELVCPKSDGHTDLAPDMSVLQV